MERESSIPALRVLQWNILADGLAQFGDFTKAPKEELEWSTRAPKLLNKILEADADILGLQELNHYGDYFLPQLQKHGFTGVFRPKRYSPAEKYGFPADGCAIFVKAFRFRLEEEVQMKYGVLIRLTDLQVNKELLVAATHLKAKSGKENDAIRLKQAQDLVQSLVISTRNGAVPSIICGDFNTTPSSAVYGLLRDHGLGFRSVYGFAHELPSDDRDTAAMTHLVTSSESDVAGEPLFTTWKFRSTGEKQETIDYIWFSTCANGPVLIPERVWTLPSATTIGPNGLPSRAMPSDHLPLLCTLAWKREETRGTKRKQEETRGSGVDHDEQFRSQTAN